MRALVLAAFAVAGCLSGDYNGPDMNVNDMAMSLPQPDMTTLFNFDLAGLDLSGLTGCKTLNTCENGATPAQALMCQMNATPTAKAEELALQNCFKKWCPIVADMGAGRCAPNDMGKVSSDCQTCINNTYVGAGTGCSPMNAPECHMCLHEAQVCASDP
jgi:hypothetical protein